MPEKNTSREIIEKISCNLMDFFKSQLQSFWCKSEKEQLFLDEIVITILNIFIITNIEALSEIRNISAKHYYDGIYQSIISTIDSDNKKLN